MLPDYLIHRRDVGTNLKVSSLARSSYLKQKPGSIHKVDRSEGYKYKPIDVRKRGNDEIYDKIFVIIMKNMQSLSSRSIVRLNTYQTCCNPYMVR